MKIIIKKISELRENIISDIIKIWYGNKNNTEEYIKKELGIKNFKICGISNNMEGLEDELLVGYQIILKLLDDKDTINDVNLINKIEDKKENEEELELDEI